MSPEKEKFALANVESNIKDTLTEINRLKNELEKLRHYYNQRVKAHHQMRSNLQRIIWASEGKRLCRECIKLQNIESFKYLYLHRLSKRSGYESGYDVAREIVCICAKCAEGILSPERHPAYIIRMLAEKQNEKFFVFHEGKLRPLEKVDGDTSSVQIKEDVNVISESLFTVGRGYQFMYK